MDITDLIKTILEKGTYTTLDRLVDTEDFQDRLADRERLFGLLANSDSDIAIALRAGHIEMCELLHSMPEYLALQQASQGDIPDPYMYELLDAVGRALVEVAGFCLPTPILQVAEHIGALDADEQIKWIGLVYDGFQYAYDAAKQVPKKNSSGVDVIWTMDTDSLGEIDITQSDIDTIVEYYTHAGMVDQANTVCRALEWLSEEELDDQPDYFDEAVNLILDYYDNKHVQVFPWLYDVTELEYPLERAMPASYGVFGQSGNIPTCFGMSIMLTAFARMTGLKTMLVSPIEVADDLHKEARGIDAVAKLDHLDAVGFERQEFRDKLHAVAKESADYQARIYDFHYSIAIQVSDGRWVHLDPYMRHFGVFDDDWELQRIFEILEKYQSVLPGLNLISFDGGSLRRRLVEFIDVLKKAINQAERVMQAIIEKPYPSENILEYFDDGIAWLSFDDTGDVIWLTDTLNALEDTDELFLNYLAPFGDQITPEHVISLREYFFSSQLLGDPQIDDPDQEIFNERIQAYWDLFYDDEEFKRDKIENIILHFIRIVIERWNTLMGEIEHTLLDPVMQFSLPEYNIALAAVGHARCWTENDVSGRVLLTLSSSQFYWHDAVDLSSGYEQSDADHSDALRAEQMLRALPFLHRACTNKLEYLSQMRETQPTREE